MAVDFNECVVIIYDPQETGNRFDALKNYLVAELFPFLLKPPSPKRLRTKRIGYVPLLDDYNCGVFVLLFFELVLFRVEPIGFEGNIKPAMQFFRYRYLSHILTSM